MCGHRAGISNQEDSVFANGHEYQVKSIVGELKPMMQPGHLLLSNKSCGKMQICLFLVLMECANNKVPGAVGSQASSPSWETSGPADPRGQG